MREGGVPCKSKVLIDQRWAKTLKQRADAVAVLNPDGSVARTFADIEREAGQVVDLLADRWPGSVVSLRAPNVAAWPAMVLGIWRAGCSALLVDATLTEEQVVAAEGECGATARLAWNAGLELRELDGVKKAGGNLIKLTSGTTGAPRALEFSGEAVMADCDQICETMEIGEADLNYGVIAFSHSYGFSNLVTPLLFRGVPVVAARDSLPRALGDGLVATGATVLPAVPAIFHALAGVEGVAAERLRLCISAGAPMRSRIGRDFLQRHGVKIRSFYGASECGGICFDSSEEREVPDGFVGTPMSGVEVVRQNDGTLSVRSAALHIGADGEFVPGDMLEGDVAVGLRIVGRMSETVNVGGRKVYPAAVEAALAKYPGVWEVVVFGRGDESRAESLVALVVGEVDCADLRVWCAGRLAGWQVPREIFLVERIPLNARGKVNRRELAGMVDAGKFRLSPSVREP